MLLTITNTSSVNLGFPEPIGVIEKHTTLSFDITANDLEIIGPDLLTAQTAGSITFTTTIVAEESTISVPTLGMVGTVTFSPQGAGDWEQLIALANANAYKNKVLCTQGTYLCDSVETLVPGVCIEFAPGCSIVASLPVRGLPASPYNSIFGCNGFVGAPSSVASAAIAVVGQLSLSLVTNPSLAVGNCIIIQDSITAGASNQAASYEVKSISGSGPYTIGLDRPLLYAFPSGSTVTKVVRAKDIRLIGNNCLVSGTYERCIDLAIAWQSYAENFIINAQQADKEYTVSFDTGSFDSTYRGMRVYEGRTVGCAIEAAENCHMYDCSVETSGAAPSRENAGIMFQAAYCCSATNCKTSGRTGASGCGINFGFVSDVVGSRRCKVFGGSFSGNLYGIQVNGGSQDIDIYGIDASNNTSNGIMVQAVGGAVPGRVRVHGGTLIRNGGSGAYIDGSIGNELNAVRTEENVNGAVQTINSGELYINNCDFQESANHGGLTSIVRLHSAGDRIVYSDGKITCPYNGFTLVFYNTGGTLVIDGLIANMATGSEYMIYQTSGFTQFSNIKSVGLAIGNGFAADAGTWRRGPNVYFNSTLEYSLGASQGNYGQVTLNGASAVDVLYTGIHTADKVFLQRRTVGGTPGATPSYTITNNTKFTVTGVAADTSVYDYWIP